MRRFRMARLPRAVRRFVLASLEALAPEALFEDVLRHRSYWVWVGEFVHPHEYATRYPNAARAFWIARRNAPDGTRAPAVETFASRLEAAADSCDGAAMTALLGERPGELARRFDHLLRVCGDDQVAVARAVERFVGLVPRMATPVLATLETLLPFRAQRAPEGLSRVFWPKGAVTTGHYTDETRRLLPASAIAPAVDAIRAELLARFAAWPRRRQWIVDRALADVPVPFNERTASVAAADLPRGSRVKVSSERWARLFLHWCQPAAGHATDLDLSVLFYDRAWGYRGVCSYYQLTCEIGGTVIARSAGDLQSAPPPDGACEFVDVDREAAVACGLRYAVALVNSYAGMPFRALERAFAGLMLRADPEGQHFDPRTVRLRFQLNGDNGGFLPMVLDLEEGTLHWLDVYVRGQLAWNNAETSRPSVERVCPTLMAWFASGQRPSMLDLALLHAAARGDEVVFRGGDLRRVSASIGIDGLRAAAREPDAGERVEGVEAGDPEHRALALVTGDLLDAAGRPVSAAESWCVFAQHQTPGLRAADWLALG